MIGDCKDSLVSATQVAYYYPQYTLDSALEMSVDQRTLLLSVVVSEHNRLWDKLATMLGTTIDLFEIAKAQKQSSGSRGELERYAHIPLLMAMAPELFTSIMDEYKKKIGRATDSDGSAMVDIGTLSAEEAKKLMLGINFTPPVGDVNG